MSGSPKNLMGGRNLSRAHENHCNLSAKQRPWTLENFVNNLVEHDYAILTTLRNFGWRKNQGSFIGIQDTCVCDLAQIAFVQGLVQAPVQLLAQSEVGVEAEVSTLQFQRVNAAREQKLIKGVVVESIRSKQCLP